MFCMHCILDISVYLGYLYRTQSLFAYINYIAYPHLYNIMTRLWKNTVPSTIEESNVDYKFIKI